MMPKNGIIGTLFKWIRIIVIFYGTIFVAVALGLLEERAVDNFVSDEPEVVEKKIDILVRALDFQFGKTDTITFSVLGRIADALVNLENYSMALRVQEKVLERARLFGEVSLSTAKAKEDLALTLVELRDFEGARRLQEEALEVRILLLDSEDGGTVQAKEVLALALEAAGNFESARLLRIEALEVRIRVRDPADEETLQAKESLASTLGALGDFKGARKLKEEVLDFRQRFWAPEHPARLRAKVDLAVTLAALGDFEGASRRLEEVLEVSIFSLGSRHPETLLAKRALALTLIELGDLAGAQILQEEVLETSITALGSEHPDTLRAKADLALTLLLLGDLAEARRLQEQVLDTRIRALGSEHPDTLLAQGALAHTLAELGDLEGARQRHEEVLEASIRGLGFEHPRTLAAKQDLARALFALGDFPGTLRHSEEVLDASIRVLGPEHPGTLSAKAHLARVLDALGDRSGARTLQEQVLEARARALGFEHPDTLEAKRNLADTLRALGDLAGARVFVEKVLEDTIRNLGVAHPDTLTVKASLADTLSELGDFAGARQLQEEVLAARQSVLGLEHPDTLTAKARLARTFSGLGDLAGARQLQEEVLAAHHRVLGFEHLATLTAKADLAGTLFALGDLAAARQNQAEVVDEHFCVVGPEHPSTLTAKANLAEMIRAQGDFAGARQLEEEVLEARRRLLGSVHPFTLDALRNLAATLRKAGDLQASSRYLEELISLRGTAQEKEHRPNTIQEAGSFFLLGANLRDLGLRDPRNAELLDRAFVSFSTGLDALEAQTLRADFSEEVRNQYKARHSSAYRDTLAVAVARDRPNDALHVLERYRTQSLLDLLRWSRPGVEPKIPEAYRAELASIAARYDRVTRHLDLRQSDANLLAVQAKLRRRREVIQGQILEERRAEEGLPTPIRPREIRRHLDSGTLLLAYSIGEEGSHLFVLDRDGPIEAYPLEVGFSGLRVQLERMRKSDRAGSTGDGRQALGQWLYEKLFGPASNRIEGAERLLILPDGPLHYLSFAALIRPASDDPRGWQYLIEHKPIHTVQSGTVYAELLSRRVDRLADESQRQWVGFGDPVYPVKVEGSDRTSDGLTNTPHAFLRDIQQRGIWDGLEELPSSDREVAEIAELFPQDRRIVLRDREATEDRARELLGQANIAHFAAHGLAYSEEPMDSFLALSLLEGKDFEHNGLLQAWEIVDHLQLDADLVVLSACVTAYGPERRGEGLISLSRAFQVAGARSVLASLWAVNDESTAELMIRFYRHLLAGQSKDEALRSAQMELIRGPIKFENSAGEQVERDFSAPYHWAAFQLIGDWQ